MCCYLSKSFALLCEMIWVYNKALRLHMTSQYYLTTSQDCLTTHLIASHTRHKRLVKVSFRNDQWIVMSLKTGAGNGGCETCGTGASCMEHPLTTVHTELDFFLILRMLSSGHELISAKLSLGIPKPSDWLPALVTYSPKRADLLLIVILSCHY